MKVDHILDVVDLQDSIGDEYSTDYPLNSVNADRLVAFIDGELVKALGNSTVSQLISRYMQEKKDKELMGDDFEEHLENAFNAFKKAYEKAGIDSLWQEKLEDLTAEKWYKQFPQVARKFIAENDEELSKRIRDTSVFDREDSDSINELIIGYVSENCLFINLEYGNGDVQAFIRKAKEEMDIDKVYVYDYVGNEEGKFKLTRKARRRK